MRNLEKRALKVEDKPKISKFGVGSSNTERATPTSEGVVLCCCVRLCCSKCSSS